jgi:HEAT repeat protein
MAAYLAHLLEQRQLERAVATVRGLPGSLADLLGLAGSLETPMGIRIGISAVVEELQDTPALHDALPALAGLAASPEPQVRADAAHYLGLTGSDGARQPLERLLADPDPQVREIAAESLALLEPTGTPHD